MAQGFRDIEWLPTLATSLDYMAKNSMNQIAALERGLDKPHLFDDQVITKTMESYTQAIEHCTRHSEQLQFWLRQNLDPEQRSEVERLVEVNQRVCAGTERILDFCSQIKQGTIDRIMEKDDVELGFEALIGSLKTPSMPAPVQRFESALAIHQFVESIMDVGGREEEIINHPEMMDIAVQFMGIMNSAQPGELDKLAQMFSGFHRFSKILENLVSLLQNFKKTASQG